MDDNDYYLLVLCECGHELGYFSPADDCGSVIMLCPSCKSWMEIHNRALFNVLDNSPDDRMLIYITAVDSGLSKLEE